MKSEIVMDIESDELVNAFESMLKNINIANELNFNKNLIELAKINEI